MATSVHSLDFNDDIHKLHKFQYILFSAIETFACNCLILTDKLTIERTNKDMCLIFFSKDKILQK